MIRAIASVAALLFGTAILLTGQGLQGTLIPVRATLENFSTISIGLMGATYFLGFTFGCWKGAVLIRAVGHVRVFAAMTATASAIPLLHGLWVNPWVWSSLRFVTGFCFAVLYLVIESWLNERSTNDNRGGVFSAYILINMTVLGVGQQMLLFYDPLDLNLFALASVLVSLAAVPVARRETHLALAMGLTVPDLALVAVAIGPHQDALALQLLDQALQHIHAGQIQLILCGHVDDHGSGRRLHFIDHGLHTVADRECIGIVECTVSQARL